MKRGSLREAFTGYGEPMLQSSAVQQEDRDVVEARVVGGRVRVVVPPEVSDDEALTEKWLQGVAMWELELENGVTVMIMAPEGSPCISLTVVPKEEG